MKRRDLAWAIGGSVVGLLIAIGVVAVRHHRAQEERPPVRLGPPPTPDGAARLTDAVNEWAARLDAQEGHVARAEDRALPAEARLDAATAALAAADRVEEAMKRVRRELDAFTPATGQDLEHLTQLRPRLGELGDRMNRLNDRLQAATAQLKDGGRTKKE